IADERAALQLDINLGLGGIELGINTQGRAVGWGLAVNRLYKRIGTSTGQHGVTAEGETSCTKRNRRTARDLRRAADGKRLAFGPVDGNGIGGEGTASDVGGAAAGTVSVGGKRKGGFGRNRAARHGEGGGGV